jgi:hypothetical protein
MRAFDTVAALLATTFKTAMVRLLLTALLWLS